MKSKQYIYRTHVIHILLPLAILAILPLLHPQIYILSLFFLIFLYITLVEAWIVIGGYAGYPSFGQTAFLGLGAYTVAVFTKYLGSSPFVFIPLGGIFASILAALIGYPCLKLRGPYFALVTLCVPLALQVAFLNFEYAGAATGIWLPLLPFDIFIERAIFYEVILVITVTVVLIVRKIEKSKFGLGLMAIRQNENAAESLGVNTAFLKLKAFVLSAFITGIAGGIYAIYMTYIHPSTVFDVYTSIFIVLLAIFSGRTWKGPILGVPALVLINEILTFVIGAEIARMLFGCLLMVFIIFLPDGLVSLLKRYI